MNAPQLLIKDLKANEEKYTHNRTIRAAARVDVNTTNLTLSEVIAIAAKGGVAGAGAMAVQVDPALILCIYCHCACANLCFFRC
jgi:hypothetical protein